MARFRIVSGFTRGDQQDEVAVPERLGEFRVLARLGAGGMGVVYRAVQERADTTVVDRLRELRIQRTAALGRRGRLRKGR